MMGEIGSIDGPTYLALLHEHAALKAENERLENGECLVKLHNALLAEGEKAKALLQQTEELEAENERLRLLLNRTKPYIYAYEESTGMSIDEIIGAIDAEREGEGWTKN